MGLFFNYNGKVFNEGTPVIGVDNRGLRYGDGLFETFKIINGQLIFIDEHFARLWKGLSILQFEIPKHFTPENLQEEIIALAKKNKQDKNTRIRLNVFRGDGGINDATNHYPNYTIQTWELPEDHSTFNSNGLVIGIYNDVIKSCDAISNMKHNNYLPSVMAALKAKKEKWNDAIILNSFNRVCETTIANIFLISNGHVYTPSKSEGCVDGVMRNHLIKQLRSNNWIVNEAAITQEMLLSADEIFLTNSIYNIRWVKQANDKIFGCSQIQKIYSQISSTFF